MPIPNLSCLSNAHEGLSIGGMKRTWNDSLEQIAYQQHNNNIRQIFADEYEEFKSQVEQLRIKNNDGKRGLERRGTIVVKDSDAAGSLSSAVEEGPQRLLPYAREYRTAYQQGVKQLLDRFKIIPTNKLEHMVEIIMADFDKEVMNPIQNNRLPNMDFSDDADANPAMIVKNHAYVKRIEEGGEHKIVFENVVGHDYMDYNNVKKFMPPMREVVDTSDDKQEYEYFVPLTYFLIEYPYLIRQEVNKNKSQLIWEWIQSDVFEMSRRVFEESPAFDTLECI